MHILEDENMERKQSISKAKENTRKEKEPIITYSKKRIVLLEKDILDYKNSLETQEKANAELKAKIGKKSLEKGIIQQIEKKIT